jgi:hypothetical protein
MTGTQSRVVAADRPAVTVSGVASADFNRPNCGRKMTVGMNFQARKLHGCRRTSLPPWRLPPR